MEALARDIRSLELTDLYSITDEEFFIYEHKGYSYYAVELKNYDPEILANIIQGCEYVENECWVAQEDFNIYISRCDILVYVVKNDRIIGFNLGTLLPYNRNVVYSNDETMVLIEYRGNSLARNLVMTTIRYLIVKSPFMINSDNIMFLSISANPRVVNGYYKFRNAFFFTYSSFKPSNLLEKSLLEYMRKNKLKHVHEDYPFCIKNIFPGSNKFGKNDKNNSFNKGVKKHMPEDFDNIERGDAFAYMFQIDKSLSRFVCSIFSLAILRKIIIFNKKIGFLRNRKADIFIDNNEEAVEPNY
jgi:hypothetical protein